MEENIKAKSYESKETILVSPTEAMRILGVGRNRMYCDLLKRDDFPAFKINSKYFVNRLKLQEWADKMCGK
ncbi:DNA-binding protein [Clostridium fermenticellae]|uniref:DNA-binding protein n=1 Tax=Clostridium fermenticellae TaxID=2068654 RepID=A0A386H242_9CLOT|nr:helix-turn-helix domain-containing protein [Clostridium fermenticellae]AYD39600.1 DNA-binding protein [Clostridium fermenticellae]AYD39615.1 DNA-binding protein [Clostridium fermenticellae]